MPAQAAFPTPKFILRAWAFFGAKSVAGSIVAFAVNYGSFTGSWFYSGHGVQDSYEQEQALAVPQPPPMRRLCRAAFGTCALTGTPIDSLLLGSTFPYVKPIAFSAADIIAGAGLRGS
ncbi:hypothetical protein FA95DRAFT_1606283 [Auriscalpium vulgare]|uniref:Uncharacterized protein n=1 Tax=Auriscalpium vulgare TaxID=40419 RepID=A0ACB8RSW2_9AGAM|nr:hypothetical protein FA95DRAFT_1606283 [Auriscalpium vulgare]